jgi:hypothetical protein
MIDQRFPFLKPYALVFDSELKTVEVISYPYPEANGLHIKVREEGDPMTMRTVRCDSLTGSMPFMEFA